MIPKVIVPLILAAWLAGCGNPPYPRGSLEQLYPLSPRPQLHQREIGGHARQWAEHDGADGTPIFFIHGSPGDWKAWAHYLTAPALADYGPRIAVDRPGFGGSQPGEVVTDLRVQAGQLVALLPPGRPAILVGHSLGAPLVAWMALLFPEQVCGGVMIAGALAPVYEAPRWYNRLADWGPLGWLLPAELRWSNAEMMPLQEELRRLESAWSNLQRPLRLLQGMRDELVDPRTAAYAEATLPGAYLSVERHADAGHFLLWTDPEAVIAAIRALPC